MNFDNMPLGQKGLDVAGLLSDLVPPKRFESMDLTTYLPNPQFPSQLQAKNTVEDFIGDLTKKVERSGRFLGRRRLFTKGVRADSVVPSAGLYIDGGFGVGKTHLLVGAYQSFHYSKAFVSFSDLTYFVGALGFQQARDVLSSLDLLCIDEFELDDPGDTVLISNLCSTLTQEGVHLVVTSNTLPDRLGDGRFSYEDFLREIQSLASIFSIVRVDGPDYRHRDFDVGKLLEMSSRSTLAHLVRHDGWLVIEFNELMNFLFDSHPVTYRKKVARYNGVVITDAEPFDDQAKGLRFVSFIDKVYEMEIPLALCDLFLLDLFPRAFLAGGFRQKYGRCLSRLYSLNLEFERKLKSDQ